jgi:uncharacterized protein (TIRG00374 family)
MNARLRIALLVVGGLLYGWVLAHIGLGTIIFDLRQAGWMLLPVLGVNLLMYTGNALAMHFVLAVEPRRPPFLRTLCIIISGFAVNYVTPVVAAGGEPLRVLALERWVGRQRAVGAVVLFTMFHSLSSLAWWLAALIAAFFIVPLTPMRLVALGGATLVVATLGGLLLVLHREGLFLRLLRLARRIPRLSQRLERWHDVMALLDTHIKDFYHAHPRRFVAALTAELLSRVAMVAELWFIGWGIGLHLSPLHALALSGLGALAINTFFFVPFGLGSKEASWMAIFAIVGSTAEFGVYASVVNRLQELIWTGVGIGLLTLLPSGAPAAVEGAGDPPVTPPG